MIYTIHTNAKTVYIPQNKGAKKMSTYEKPKVEVIHLDKNASFMTESVTTIIVTGPSDVGGDNPLDD